MFMHQDIIMQKYNENDLFVTYQVMDCINNLKFFVKIDKKNIKAICFKTEKFDEQPLGIIDLSDENAIIPSMNGIIKATLNRVTYEAFKALTKNIFPDKICYTSL